MAQKWKKKKKQKEFEYKEKKSKQYKKWYLKNREKKINSTKRYYEEKRGELIKELGGKCAFCGIKDILPSDLNIHHRVPMVVQENKLAHYIRNKDIMLLLCRDCHMMWHYVMDELKIDDIFKDENTPKDFYERMY